jgi:hypothetical protein
MATYTVDSTKVGTSLVAAAGTMTAITVAAVPNIANKSEQINITDGPNGRSIFSANQLALISLFEPRPGIGLTPGLTAPAFPRSVSPGSQAFANGLYVQSCPAGVSLTITA